MDVNNIILGTLGAKISHYIAFMFGIYFGHCYTFTIDYFST